MRRGIKYAVKKGQVIGGDAPYGYRHVRKTNNAPAHWEIDPQEAEIVRTDLRFVCQQEGMKGTAISKRLEAKVFPADKRKEVVGSSIYDILKNETYLGTAYMYKTKSAVPAKHPQSEKYSKRKKSTM